MGSVISFDNMNDNIGLKFIRDIIKIETVNENTGEIEIERRVVIKIKNLTNGKSRIHRFTDFLGRWKNKKTKTVSDLADKIVTFLNYVYFDLNKTVLPSIEYLTFELGAKFLNTVCNGKSNSYASQIERALSYFYFFLADKNILKNITKKEFKFIDKGNRIVLVSPFEGMYEKPPVKQTDRLHHFDEELIFTFLETAIEVSPNIALGIYCQFFGGLRVSEVVSLEYHNISFKGKSGLNGMILRISNNDLAPELKTGFINQAKRERKQTIFNIGNLLPLLYENHKKHYKNKNTSAIFVNLKGRPMTDRMYRYYFNKIKRAFISRLRDSNNPKLKIYSAYLMSKSWSTHIGRGVFSNISNDVADNAVELAVARGDKTLNAALSYTCDSKKIEEKLAKNMNSFYVNRLKEKIIDIDKYEVLS